jgi:predicted ATPase
VLATSRERLNVSGEHEYPVPTLPLEDAVALFTQRARQLQPRFEPDDNVAELARRLDGLPLALELAAARVKALTPEQIVERLGQSLDVLTGGVRDAPERQQTLRATIEWSYQLLDEQEQDLFARLAVFVGGCTLAAAERVVNAELDVLQSLVDKNLLRYSEARFWMLETIRQLALEKLELREDAEQLRRRHAEYLLEFLPTIETAGDAALLARESAESANLRAAVEWALHGQHADLALGLAVRFTRGALRTSARAGSMPAWALRTSARAGSTLACYSPNALTRASAQPRWRKPRSPTSCSAISTASRRSPGSASTSSSRSGTAWARAMHSNDWHSQRRRGAIATTHASCWRKA